MADKDLTESPVRELVRRFFITFLLGVVVFRLGAHVVIPGVDAEAMRSLLQSGKDSGGVGDMVVRWLDMFSGGAIQNSSIFGLGVTPYISASIIIQLLTFSIPALKAMQKEGEGGRRRINQYTRYATLLICLVQSFIAALALTHVEVPPGSPPLVPMAIEHKYAFIATAMLVITTGSMVILWLAEQITKHGIGNGVSIIIAIGILAYFPNAFTGVGTDLPKFLTIAAVGLCLIAAIVVVVQAVRRINLEQQRRVQGNRVFGGAQTTLPLKINQANVIPVIFASPVLIGLGMLAKWDPIASTGIGQVLDYGSVGHRYIFAGLIIFFTYFYISITFDLHDMSNHFKQAGFFVRGIRPGKNTVDHLQSILARITFVGAIFLALIAILPEVAGNSMNMRGANLLIGGTGLLIIVGVALDVMQKVGSFFLAHQYRGMGADGKGGPSGAKRF